VATKKSARGASAKKTASATPNAGWCDFAELPDLDDDPGRQEDKTRRLHQLGTDLAAHFIACTGSPRDRKNYLDPRSALAVLLQNLVKTNVGLVEVQGCGLDMKVGAGSGHELDVMAKRVAWSLYQAGDHNFRMQNRFRSISIPHPEPVDPDMGGFCLAAETPDLGDPELHDITMRRLHELGKQLSASFVVCTGADPASSDYIDPRIALAILLARLVRTNRDLVNAQGSALSGKPGVGAGKVIDQTARNAAQRFLDEAEHNVKMHVRYKSLAWVAANQPRSGRSPARARGGRKSR
jgi:hypothetical protein